MNIGDVSENKWKPYDAVGSGEVPIATWLKKAFPLIILRCANEAVPPTISPCDILMPLAVIFNASIAEPEIPIPVNWLPSPIYVPNDAVEVKEPLTLSAPPPWNEPLICADVNDSGKLLKSHPSPNNLPNEPV